MSGVQRLLGKREKRGESPSTRHRISMYLSASPNHSTSSSRKSMDGIDPDSVADLYGLFSDSTKPNNAEESKVKSLRQRIIIAKSILVKDDNIQWALRCRSSKGDADSAYDLLSAMADASQGIILAYDPHVKLLGAVNRQAVTCYLDSVLFAMFSRLDSFEAMLYNTFDDQPRNRLSFLLRLWVNLLRAGKLIPTEVTKVIQETLAECGWEDAALLRQQDASEAFTFITEKLKLPLLTLKMDMYHSGKHDDDDHRFINERLLEVAIPKAENGEQKDVKLEDCLEDYFNNRIEVRRFLERRTTMSSANGNASPSKAGAVHVESVELDDSDSPMTPTTPLTLNKSTSRPVTRSRATSIIQERFVPDIDEKREKIQTNGNGNTTPSRLRKGSVRKEVLMPAWQFFSLIPWYTNHAPTTDAQVAAHFSSKRPILGLCLKRYSMTHTGKAIRLNTIVDIPIEIGLPHFIQDDKMDRDGPLYGNFKLSLQSVVCHRGNSVDSGHYISLVRSTPRDPNKDPNHWMRFDDLAAQKITMIDIHQALRDETPYLVFYQIIPVDGDPSNLTMGENPPPYTESQTLDPGATTTSVSPEVTRSLPESQPLTIRPSIELNPLNDRRTIIMPGDIRRPSTAITSDVVPVGKTSRPQSRERTPQEHRKSSSFSRSISRGNATVAVATTSVVSTNHTKDEQSSPQVLEPISPTVNDHRALKDALAKPTSDMPMKMQTLTDPTREPEQDGRGRRRDKSRNRLGKMHMGKARAQKPDRECNVM